jgi:ABC-type phosphate/phosphonate transport system substrate-binding protein
MDDMVIFGTNKRKLHKLRKEITTFIKQTLNLEIKDNWQIFFLDSTKSKKKKGRFLDFLGFKFYRTHMGLRSRLALRA